MSHSMKTKGFSLVELLLVLAIIGIISGIAIPAFMGQRARARSIGDAQSNSQVLRMQLESLKADTGTYGTGGPFAWNYSPAPVNTNAPTAATATAYPAISLASSKMNFTLTLGTNGLTYTIVVADPRQSGTPSIFKTDQTGASLPLP